MTVGGGAGVRSYWELMVAPSRPLMNLLKSASEILIHSTFRRAGTTSSGVIKYNNGWFL